jgi:uncharacterized protein YndB with AHSA1/START domain
MRRFLFIAFLVTLSPLVAEAQERQIRVSVTVAATPEQVWPLWTTDEGVRSFFAPGSHIDLVVDGAYEIFFDPSAPPGKRGADGMRLLAVEPNRRLAFTWNAPEMLAYARAQRTVVIVDFTPVGSDSTRVTLRHIGWGAGPEWDRAIRYFEPAWNGFVMASFKRRMEQGPINWAALPDLQPVQPSAIEELAVRTP